MKARQLLLFGGIALALLGMSHGLWYAIFAEHQALDRIGQSLSLSFQAAAHRNTAEAEKALLQYREAKYAYDRMVDVHGHCIGLSMLLIILAIGFDRLAISNRRKLLLAWALLLGTGLFPLGVLMQTWSHAPGPKAVAVLGSALVTAAVAGTAFSFLRRQGA